MTQSIKIARITAPIEVRVEDDAVVVPLSSPFKARKADDEILERFLGIRSTDDIARFIRRYGLLEAKAKDHDGEYRESLTLWRDTARRMGAIRDAAFYLNAGSLPPREVIETLAKGPYADRVKRSGKENVRIYLRIQIASAISQMLSVSDLRPQLIWNQKQGAWSLGLATTSFGMAAVSDSCLGALIWKLLLEVTGSRGALCSICGGWYPAPRMPSEGRGNYCPRCRENGAMWRHLKRTQRERKANGNGKTGSK